jgi:peptidoglycan/xylan/chitin deacetylase (PgdA/CDA1 family)
MVVMYRRQLQGPTRPRAARGLALLALALIVAPTSARGGSWPTPAAGPSASGQPELLFTFDDGPNRNTERVLETLHQHHAQAVFFLVGEMLDRGDPVLVQRVLGRMLGDGHVIANHTMTHAQLCGGTPEAATAEIVDARAVIERHTALRAEWFRTPYGARCARHDRILGELGIAHFHWDIDPQEWQHHDAQRTAAYVLGRARRLTGRAVVLMHDIHPVTARALPLILDGLDAENAKRREAGQPEIRIVSPSEVAAEHVVPGLLAWMRDTLDGAVDALAGAGAAVP